MKKLFVILFSASIALLGALGAQTNIEEREYHVVRSEYLLQSLEQAFATISKIPGFQPLTQEELKEMYPSQLGIAKCAIHGNANPRDKVLEILDNISKELLYAEYRTENDKITRCYIGYNSKGEAQLLYVFVGLGGNDLVVSLFTGAPISVYKEEADSMK